MALSAFKPWLVNSTKESYCKVTDCGSHVQRVLTGCDGGAPKFEVAGVVGVPLPYRRERMTLSLFFFE